MIVLFSAPWCSQCPAAKAVLDRAGVEYKVIDIDQDPEKAMEAGIRGIPTVITQDGSRFTTATLAKLAEYISHSA